MKIWLAALVIASIAGGCSGSSSTSSAGSACKLTESSNSCLHCWAQKCPTQLDYCYGAGFHSGEMVSSSSSNGAAACSGFSNCLQICGCYDSCFESCIKEITGNCAECQQKYFFSCRQQNCSAECSAGDGGA